MRFYTKQHKFYCGIDLHARKMYGYIRVSQKQKPTQIQPGIGIGTCFGCTDLHINSIKDIRLAKGCARTGTVIENSTHNSFPLPDNRSYSSAS